MNAIAGDIAQRMAIGRRKWALNQTVSTPGTCQQRLFSRQPNVWSRIVWQEEASSYQPFEAFPTTPILSLGGQTLEKSERRVWHIGWGPWGGSVHCGMLGILLIAELCKACRVFCWTRHTYKRSIFPAWCLQHYKTKQNTKTVLVRLAFPINAHQNANQKPIGSAPSYRAQCTLPPQQMCHTLLFNFSRVWFRDYPILYFIPRLISSRMQKEEMSLGTRLP